MLIRSTPEPKRHRSGLSEVEGIKLLREHSIKCIKMTLQVHRPLTGETYASHLHGLAH